MTKHTCPKCGATLSAPGASCRRCLLELAVAARAQGEPSEVVSGAPRPGTPPPRPGELAPLFPELELEVLLGAGGMGAVYRARQRKLGRVVALKLLHGELSRDPVFVERFLREAQALATLAHPGIVAVHDFGEREGRCFLVMEFIDGANLRALMKARRLPAREALDVVRQLCEALQFAHDEGVVHRDIKPENVLVDRHGRVKIADFGLAKLVGARASVTLTGAGDVMGTPHYMAPEQIEHPRDVDHRADLFSLGVVFYEMLTGELPLGRFQPPSKRVELDVRLDQIVLRTLERERELRYQSAVEVRTDVEAVERAPAAAPSTQVARDSAPDQPAPGEKQAVIGWELDFSTERPTAWGWLVILFLGWVLSGALFDLGRLAFTLLALPLLLWLFLALVQRRASADPAAEEPRPWRARIGAGLLATLGLLVLCVAHVAAFERGTWHYVSSSQGAGEGVELGLGSSSELLRHAGLPPGTAPVVELDSSHRMDVPHALYELHPLPLALLALALFGAAAWAAAARRDLAGSLGLWFGSLGLVHGLTLALDGGGQLLTPVADARAATGTVEARADALRLALLERGYSVHAEHHGRLVERSSRAELAQLVVLQAAPAAPFERWRLTWKGPRRLEPELVFHLVSDPSGQRAAVSVDAGAVARGGPEQQQWRDRIEELLAASASGG